MAQFTHGPANGPRDSGSGVPPLPTVTTPHHEHPAQAPHGHGGHAWAMWLMCVPMLLLVGTLITTGRLGAGGLLYALGCLLMMGVMMAWMNHGTNHEHKP